MRPVSEICDLSRLVCLGLRATCQTTLVQPQARLLEDRAKSLEKVESEGFPDDSHLVSRSICRQGGCLCVSCTGHGTGSVSHAESKVMNASTGDTVAHICLLIYLTASAQKYN